MRNAIGLNMDFYASSVKSKINLGIDHISERARWINGSNTGNLGVEKDDKLGTFYIGAEVNIPISAIMDANLNIIRWN